MADLTLPISFNAFSINSVTRTNGGVPMSGYLVDDLTLSSVDVDAFLDKRALQDGVDASDIYLGARHVEVIVSVFGSSKADFWDKANSLLAAFSPTLAYASDTANLGFLPFDWFQPTGNISIFPLSAYPNGIPMRMYLRPAGLPAYASRRDEQGGVASKGISKQFRIPMLARNPRKVVQSETTLSIAQTAASTSTSTPYLGNYPTTGTITIVSGSSTGIGNFGIDASFFAGSVANGHRFTIDAVSSTYILDLGSKTFYKGAFVSSGTIRMDIFTAGTWKYPGSNPTVTLLRGAGPSFSCALAYRDAFA